MLFRGRSDDPMRSLDIALRIRRAGDEVTLDDADVDRAKKALLDDPAWADIIRAVGLRCLESAEPFVPAESDKPKEEEA